MPRKLRNIELKRLTIEEYKDAKKYPVHVLLDNVRSMHNVGSVFRSSDAFGIEKLYLGGITARPPHREITKSAIGAELAVDWEYVENPEILISQLKSNGYTIAGIEQTDNGIALQDFKYNKEPIVIIFGNEINGISDEVLALCDVVLEIPQFGTKHSLNVSVTAGVVLWDLIKRFQS